MNKKLLALKILLPVLVIMLAVLLTLEIKCWDLHDNSGSSWADALTAVFAILLNIIPMIAMIILGLGSIVVSVLLFTAKKTMPVVIGALVILCLLVPFAGFSVFVDITALRMFIEVPITAAVTLAVNIAALVLCCILIHEHRKHKKNSTAPQTQPVPPTQAP